MLLLLRISVLLWGAFLIGTNAPRATVSAGTFNRNTVYFKMFLSKSELKRILNEPGFKGALFSSDHDDNWWSRDKVYLSGFSYYDKNASLQRFHLDTVTVKRERKKIGPNKQMTSYGISKDALLKLYKKYESNEAVQGFLLAPFETNDPNDRFFNFVRYEIRPARANKSSFLDSNKNQIVEGTLDPSPPAPPQVSE